MGWQDATDIDLAAVRAALDSLREPDGAPSLDPGAVVDVVSEGTWTGVVLDQEASSSKLLRRAHAQLSDAFPGRAFELRAGRLVFRGGAGLGEDRHLVAVLGGKGGVGKSTLAVNLALTL